MPRLFRWNFWNIEHIAEHGVSVEEAESVVSDPSPSWPEKIERDKRRVWGQTIEGSYIQVIYLFDPPGVVFVIHARDLTDKGESEGDVASVWYQMGQIPIVFQA